MEQGEKKKVTIYLPNIKESLSKELQAKEKAIKNILKDTPFENDTNTIFEHLVKLQDALHLTATSAKTEEENLKEWLSLIDTLIVLHGIVRNKSINIADVSCVLPKEFKLLAIQAIKRLNVEYKNNPNLCLFGTGKYTNKIYDNEEREVSDTQTDFYCLEVVEYRRPTIFNLRKLKTRLESIKKQAGKHTYTKETPNKLTPKFRVVCAIAVFCQCDGFTKWQKKAQRNKIIFDCLQVFGYVDNGSYLDANTQRSRVRDAEESDIIFVSPPL
jgi:hypothetical protein